MPTVTLSPGANISAAVSANPAGTTFQLASGTYRGQQFFPKDGDQFIGAPGGGTILSGAIQLNGWEASGGYYVQSGLPAPLQGTVVGSSDPLSSNLNDLFVNNVLYTRVGSLAQVTAGTWYFNPATRSAYLSESPAGTDVEYSVTPTMASGGSGVVMQNLTIERYATDAQFAPLQDVTNWYINNVTSTQNHGAGLVIGAGTIVQGGHYDQNGQVGIDGYSANGAQVNGVDISGNDYAGYYVDWDAGGMKFTNSANVTISGNSVHDNTGQGIWADSDSRNWSISNNYVANNTRKGIMYELSHGAVISGNTSNNNGGSDIYISNSDGVTVFGNAVTVRSGNTFGSGGSAGGGGIDIINDFRGSGPSGLYQSINDSVHNNTINHPNDTASDGIFAGQAFSGNPNNTFNSNTYRVSNPNGAYWRFGNSNWGTTYNWTTLHQNTSFESSGTLSVGQSAAAPTSTTASVASGLPQSVATTAITADSLVAGSSQDASSGGIRFLASPNASAPSTTATDRQSVAVNADATSNVTPSISTAAGRTALAPRDFTMPSALASSDSNLVRGMSSGNGPWLSNDTLQHISSMTDHRQTVSL